MEQVKNVPGQGFVDTIKNKVHWDTLVQKIQQSKTHIIDALLYGGLGIVIGFFLKRYNMYVLAGVVTLLLIALLQYFGILTIVIHWDYLNTQFGIPIPISTEASQLGAALWDWVRSHAVISISLMIGFLLGLGFAQ